MTLSLIVETTLIVLLAATLGYCAVLERRLASLRHAQDGFKKTIQELNAAITLAGTSIRQLKSAATGATEALDERIAGARNMIDELSLLTASGERIAARIERGAIQPAELSRQMTTPAVLANRLDALRTPRADGARAAGQVR